MKSLSKIILKKKSSTTPKNRHFLSSLINNRHHHLSYGFSAVLCVWWQKKHKKLLKNSRETFGMHLSKEKSKTNVLNIWPRIRDVECIFLYIFFPVAILHLNSHAHDNFIFLNSKLRERIAWVEKGGDKMLARESTLK